MNATDVNLTASPRPAAAITTATRRRRSRVGRGALVALITAILMALGAGVASAHVTVNPGEAEAGSWMKLTFRVPTESADASTVALTVSLPTDHPFPNVSLMPVPGWVATSETKKLDPPVVEGKFTLDKVTSSITWTAQDGNGIKPGEFQEFSISVGPVPDVASLVLPAEQTYSDGSVVEWKDVAATGQDPHSLDHPAPLLAITQPAGDSSDAAAPATGGAATDSGPTPSTASGATSVTVSASDTTAQILGGVALLVAAIALVFAALGWRRSSTPKTRYDVSPAASGAPPTSSGDSAGEQL